ncbi:hypothetical protein [Krasilnikovia sp. MM14-A1259]|uniref:hypothetical protein n=1 Tax=Krasilnikovia sp. MM14-A1259 TaxID=3373539 RepID=UPI0037FA2E3C
MVAAPLDDTYEPGRWADLRLTLTFPNGAEFASLRGWDDNDFRWRRFRSAREGEIFVPDDIALMKGVRARFSV